MHRITKHGGKCKNIHGHRYEAELTLNQLELNSLGMVVDFADMKARWGSWIDEHLDHGAIIKAGDVLELKDGSAASMADTFRRSGSKVFETKEEPTAENIAKLLADVASAMFGVSCVKQIEPGFATLETLNPVHTLKVWETPNCWAEYLPTAFISETVEIGGLHCEISALYQLGYIKDDRSVQWTDCFKEYKAGDFFTDGTGPKDIHIFRRLTW